MVLAATSKPSPLRLGPLSDFRLSQRIVAHKLMADALPADLRARIGTPITSGTRDESASFAVIQDYYPLFVRVSDPSVPEGERVEVLRYFSKIVLNEHGQPQDGADPSAPYREGQSAYRSQPKRYGAPTRVTHLLTRTLPLLAEKGNLVLTDRYVISTDKLARDNSVELAELTRQLRAIPQLDRESIQHFAEQLRLAGYRARSSEEVRGVLSDQLGIPRSNALLLPILPGDKVGHSDTYVGSIQGDTVAVPRVHERAIELLGPDFGHEKAFARGINAFLDAQARRLREAGLTVERPLMLPPKNLKHSSLSALGWDADFLSPVNWAIHDGTVYVPTYESALDYLPEETRAEIIRELRSSVREAVEKHGLKASFHDARKLVGTGAGFHCITSNIWAPEPI